MDRDLEIFKHYVNAARVACRESLDCEPTDEQMERAINQTDEMEKADGRMFLYGVQLSRNLILTIEADNGVPWERSALNIPKTPPKRKLAQWQIDRRKAQQRRYREKRKAKNTVTNDNRKI